MKYYYQWIQKLLPHLNQAEALQRHHNPTKTDLKAKVSWKFLGGNTLVKIRRWYTSIVGWSFFDDDNGIRCWKYHCREKLQFFNFRHVDVIFTWIGFLVHVLSHLIHSIRKWPYISCFEDIPVTLMARFVKKVENPG